MSRRVSLPGADELFRHTAESAATASPGGADSQEEPVRLRPPLAAAPEEPEPPRPPRRTASGRVRHDEKMTVYVTADELLEVEHARLVLRRTLGSAVDRGRLVRAAVAMALADLDEHGADSELVRRLSDS
ncbi:MAG TPA: hypothetical protein VHG70_15645 [Nocardioidaceae bacterium]|nr:hypothetical protein [Nocardioidaceae bacterium]